jgi:hypothetical protein
MLVSILPCVLQSPFCNFIALSPLPVNQTPALAKCLTKSPQYYLTCNCLRKLIQFPEFHNWHLI